MKKIITFVSVAVLLFAFAFNADAQNQDEKKIEFGLRFMPTFSSFGLRGSSGGTINGQLTLGFGAGALLGYNFSQHVGVQGEIIYSSISQKSTDQNVERDITLKYINVPLLLSLNTGKWDPINLNFVVGPQMGINVGSGLSTSGGNTNDPQPALAVKKSDLGFAYGAGIDFALNKSHTFRLGLGFRGVYGLVDISDNSKTIADNSYLILDRTHIKTYSAYGGLSILF